MTFSPVNPARYLQNPLESTPLSSVSSSPTPSKTGSVSPFKATLLNVEGGNKVHFGANSTKNLLVFTFAANTLKSSIDQASPHIDKKHDIRKIRKASLTPDDSFSRQEKKLKHYMDHEDSFLLQKSEGETSTNPVHKRRQLEIDRELEKMERPLVKKTLFEKDPSEGISTLKSKYLNLIEKRKISAEIKVIKEAAAEISESEKKGSYSYKAIFGTQKKIDEVVKNVDGNTKLNRESKRELKLDLSKIQLEVNHFKSNLCEVLEKNVIKKYDAFTEICAGLDRDLKKQIKSFKDPYNWPEKSKFNTNQGKAELFAFLNKALGNIRSICEMLNGLKSDLKNFKEKSLLLLPNSTSRLLDQSLLLSIDRQISIYEGNTSYILHEKVNLERAFKIEYRNSKEFTSGMPSEDFDAPFSLPQISHNEDTLIF